MRPDLLQDNPGAVPPTLLACLAGNKLRLTAAARACRMQELILAGAQPCHHEQLPLPLSGPAGESPNGDIACLSMAFSSCGGFLATVCVTSVPGPSFVAVHAVAVYTVDKAFKKVGVFETSCNAEVRWAPKASSLSIHQMPSWHYHTRSAKWPSTSCPLVFVVDVAQWQITHRLGPDMLGYLLSLAPYPRTLNKVMCEHIVWCPAGRYLLAHGLWAPDSYALDVAASQPADIDKEPGRGVQEPEMRLMILDVHSDALVAWSEIISRSQGSVGGVLNFHPAVWHPLQSLVVLSRNVELSDPSAFAHAGFLVASLPAHCSLSHTEAPNATITCVLPHINPSIFSPDATFMFATMGTYPYGPHSGLGHCVCALSTNSPFPSFSVVHVIEGHNIRMNLKWASRSILLVCGPGDAVTGLEICTGAELYKMNFSLVAVHVRLPEYAWDIFGKAEGHGGMSSHSLWSAESGQKIWQDLTRDACTSFEMLIWSPTGCSFAYTSSLGEQQRRQGAVIRYVRFM